MIPLELLETPKAGELFVDLVIRGNPWFALVPQPGSKYLTEGVQAIVVVCSTACADALKRELSDGQAKARGESPPQREPTKREVAEADRLLRSTCAWCLKAVSRRAPVPCLYAKLKPRSVGVARTGGIVSITIGDRLVPGWLAENGSEIAMRGADIAFLLCSDACARGLSAAIALETSLSMVH